MPTLGSSLPKAPAAPLIAGVFGCEAVATLLIATGKSPFLGLLFVAAGISIAFAWLRRYGREADALVAAQLETAKALLADGSRTAAWNAARAAAHAAADGGHADRAIEILERARAGGAFDGEAARLLVELYAASNDLTRAVRVAVEHVCLLEEHDLRNMIASLEAWDEPAHAATLSLVVALRRSVAARAQAARSPATVAGS
jgi:lipopolysaccharide biosynthesis regulator YciM